MIGNFKDVRETQVRFADSPLGKQAVGISLEKYAGSVDRPLAVVCDVNKNCPIENGRWSGERGNSKWIPDEGYVPQKSNPEAKNWGKF